MQLLRESVAPRPGTIDVGWAEGDNVKLAKGLDTSIRIAALYGQGGMFISGKDVGSGSVEVPRVDRYVVAARFDLDDSSSLNRALNMACGLSRGTPAKVTLILPDTPSIRESYGPQLEDRIRSLAVSTNDVSTIYDKAIIPNRAADVVRKTWTATVDKFRGGQILESTANQVNPSESAESGEMVLQGSARLIMLRNPRPQPAPPPTTRGHESHAPSFTVPHWPSDMPANIPLVMSLPDLAELHTQRTTYIGRYTPEGVKMTDDSDLCILNVAGQGALFVWGVYHIGGTRWILGAKFSLSDGSALERAARMTHALGLVLRVEVVLPTSQDTNSRYAPELIEALQSTTYIPFNGRIIVSYYELNAPTGISETACSFTANLKDYKLETNIYPATVNIMHAPGSNSHLTLDLSGLDP